MTVRSTIRVHGETYKVNFDSFPDAVSSLVGFASEMQLFPIFDADPIPGHMMGDLRDNLGSVQGSFSIGTLYREPGMRFTEPRPAF